MNFGGVTSSHWGAKFRVTVLGHSDLEDFSYDKYHIGRTSFIGSNRHFNNSDKIFLQFVYYPSGKSA